MRGGLARVFLLVAVLGSALATVPGAARAATTELFFSEYVEGTSNNKALEIFNGTGATVNLAAGGYSVRMFFNGSPSAGLSINLTGTVAAGDVFVLAHSSASGAVLAVSDQTNGSGWYNGDDAVVLRKGTTVIDAIGQVGVDPGTEWGTGLTSTADNTLRRKGAIQGGDPIFSDEFDPAPEWDGFATDTFGGLGTHTLAGVTLDPGDILVADASADAVFRVEAGTGAQAAVSAGNHLLNPVGVTLDPLGRVLVADSACCGTGTGGIIRVEPATGAQTVLASGVNLVDPFGVAVQASGKLLVVDAACCGGSQGGLIRVDPGTGGQTVVASGGNLIEPRGIAIEASGDVLVADLECCGGGNGGVVRVDPGTGAQTVLASGGNFVDPRGMDVEASAQILVADFGCCAGSQGGVIRVDPVTGGQSVVSSAGTFLDPTGVAVEASGDILIADRNCCAASQGGVIRVNPSSGTQAVLASGGNLVDPSGIEIVTPGIQELTVDADGTVSGGNAVVGGTITCSAPERWTVTASVVQKSTGARGKNKDAGACTGTPDAWSVKARHGAGPAFAPGSARVVAAAQLLRAGELRDEHQVQASVSLG